MKNRLVSHEKSTQCFPFKPDSHSENFIQKICQTNYFLTILKIMDHLFKYVISE